MKAPRICGCGKRVPAGTMCACQVKRARERKAASDARRPRARQRGYDSKWDIARKDFLKAHPCCARCPSPATVVDHIIPHRGDMLLFWKRGNWQPLCTPCHNRQKQSFEHRTFK